jgi:hypothetical protein
MVGEQVEWYRRQVLACRHYCTDLSSVRYCSYRIQPLYYREPSVATGSVELSLEVSTGNLAARTLPNQRERFVPSLVTYNR